MTILKHTLALAFLISSSCLAAVASANTIDLAVLNDQSAKITASKNWKCSPNVSVTVEASDASFFEARLNDLGALYGAALAQLSSRCPTLSQVSIYGKTNSIEVIKGQSKKTDGWVLRLDQSNLTKDALRIPSRIKSFDDLTEMLDIYSPYRTVPGINKTSGYNLFAQNSRAAVQNLLSDPAMFEEFIESSTLASGEEKRRERINAALSIVKLYEPQIAQNLTQRVSQIQNATLRSAALRVLAQETSQNGPIKVAVADTHAHLSAKTPDTATLAEVDASLATWVENRILAHEQTNEGSHLDSARAHMEFFQNVSTSNIDGLLPETQTAVDTASFWFEALSEELLAENVGEAEDLIEASGTSYQEIDLILETGLALHDEFLKHGFEAEADELLELAKSRIEQAIDNGLGVYKNQMLAENMTLERVAFYKEEADLFYALSEDYPGFAAYVEIIEEGVRVGQLQACAVVANTVETRANRQAVTVVGRQSLSLKSLACALYSNGHLLTDVSIERGGRDGSITLLENNLDEVVFEITSTGEENAFWGVSDAWDEEMGALIIPPPTGKPDRNGVTECDVLAGDPHDTTLPTKGVVLEDVDFDYDFDRAIEACIAAVEHDPGATRQVYQLARVLEFLGDAESAAHYAEVAARRKYAPAIHLQAFNILTYRDDDDAFFDAIDLLKVSSSLGYGPSKSELNELMPPGVDIFRPIPEPTDSEILSIVAPFRVENFIGGTEVEVEGMSVRERTCFQVSKDQFSCEITIRYRCKKIVKQGRYGGPARNENPFRLLDMMFVSDARIRTDCENISKEDQFIAFTKKSGGWSFKREF